MSLDVGELVAYQRVDTSKVSKDMAKGEAIITTSAAKTGEKAGGLLGGSLGKALKSGLAIGAGFVAFKSVENFIHGSVEAAESLNQSMGRGKVVFGAAEKSVEQWASTTDKSIGLSKAQAIEYASQLGNVTDQLGFTADASATMAEKTTTLAVQVAAFKKVDPSVVIAAISAGYRDQYRAITKLIPGVTKANVETEALRETGKTTAASLTGQEKATALLTLAQQNGAQATSFYGGEANKMAREQKDLNAEITNIKASVGEIAIPFLEQLGHIAAYDVIPAVREAGQVLVELAKDINGLPTPVKAAGASLLALVLLGPEIRELADSVGNNLSSALETARIQALYAHDAFTQAGGGVKGLAKAIGTSAGGGLRAAAGGLLDIIGGPWGLAFLGASAAVGVLISKHEQGKQEIDNYTAAIKADSGALGTNTKAAIVNTLAKTDAFKLAKQLGISLDDLTGYLLDNADAQERVNATLAGFEGPADSAAGRSDTMFHNAKDLGAILGDQNGKVQQAAQGAKDFAKAMGDQGAAADGAASSQDDLSTATDGTTTSTKNATVAVQTYIDRLDAAIGRALGLRAANRGYQAALDDATKALKDNGRTLDIHSQKGRDNAAALDAVVTAIQAQADASTHSGTITDATRTKLEHERNALIVLATKFYGSRDAAEAYVNSVLKIPKKVNTDFTVSGITSAIQQARTLGNLLQANSLQQALGYTTGSNYRSTPKDPKAPKGTKPPAKGPGKAGGGLLRGAGTSTSDSIPLMGSVGEFMVKASAVASVGASNLDVMNRTGRLPASGPLVHADQLVIEKGTPDDLGVALRYHLRAAGLY